jgi:hypothetical protein
MKSKGLFMGMLVLSFVLTGCSAETTVKDTFAGTTWSGKWDGEPGTITFAKEGGTYKVISEDENNERSYKAVMGIEITLEGDEDDPAWVSIDEDKLIIDDHPYAKISGKEIVANTKWGDDQTTIEFSKSTWVASSDGEITAKGTYKVAPSIVFYGNEIGLVLIDDKLTSPYAGDDFLLTKGTASKQTSAKPKSAGGKTLVGTWQAYDSELTEGVYGEAGDLANSLVSSMKIAFTKDTYTFEAMGRKMSVPYKIKGNSIVTEMYGVTQEIPFKLNGDTLTFNNMDWKRVK